MRKAQYFYWAYATYRLGGEALGEQVEGHGDFVVEPMLLLVFYQAAGASDRVENERSILSLSPVLLVPSRQLIDQLLNSRIFRRVARTRTSTGNFFPFDVSVNGVANACLSGV